MLPAQKRKALVPPDSPPQAKRDCTAAAPGLPTEPPASSLHIGSVHTLLPGTLSPEGKPGLRADVDTQGQVTLESPKGTCPRPADQRTEGSVGETALCPSGMNRSQQLAEAPSLSSQAAEADPAVTGLARSGSPQGPNQQPGHSIAPEPPSRSDRDGLSSHETHKGPPSDDEKDEGERNLVITVEEGESATKKRKKKVQKREKKWKEGKGVEEMQPDCDIQLDDSFEQALEDGAKQHNLTAINVRNILHEVITNEHVVAMMKAAIFDTEQPHLFEPKMTRSKLKEVVEKGVVPPTWNISPIKSKESKAPQFIDIPLEEEDSSDEEYRPEEEEEDETAEEGFLESDAESTTSSPAGSGRPRSRQELLETEEELPGVTERDSGLGVAARHLSVETIPMGPPPLPPKAKHKQSRDTSFMEKLHAVDEELASNEVCMDSYQSLNDCLIAYRTRSKWPLNNVSLGLLEAELKAPDITADMYDQGTQDDVYWQNWMKALMNDLDYEDDEDDPEYNFLEDLDEPDMEDFRNDRAVQITKKEVNELMEELFETFQDEMGVLDVEEEAGDDDTQEQLHNTFNTPQAMRFEEPLANILNEQHRTVKAQIEQLRQRKARQQVSATETKCPSRRSQQPDTLFLDQQQQRQLQQQMQQHVQLLTQVYLLTSINPSLSQEAATSRVFLKELDSFAEKASEVYSAKEPDFSSMFSPCNLPEALALIEEFDANIKPHVKIPPRKDDQKMNRRFDESNYLPKEVAWIVATRALFMYPELLPHTALQPKHPKDKAWFSKGEDNLLVLGLKHFEETDFPKPLISQYLMPPKTYHQLSVRIKNLSVSRAPDNVIKAFKKTKVVLPMPSPYTAVSAEDRKPPIEREESQLPYWLQRSLPAIHRWLELRKEEARPGEEPAGGTELKSTDADTELPEGEGGQGRQGRACSPPAPLQLPDGILLLLKPRVSHLTKRELRRHKRRPSAGKPVLIHPAVKKTPCKQPGPLLPPKHGVRPPPRLIQPAPSAPLVPQLCQPQAVPVLGTSRPTPSPWLCLGSAGRKPRGRRAGRSDARGRRPRPTIVPLPVQRAPVILTVPPGVKLLSLPSGCCNVLDVPPGQTLQLATMLVSPSAFACPVTQPVAGAPLANGAAPGCGAPSDCHMEVEGSSSCSTSRREDQLVKEGSPGPWLENVTLSPGPEQRTVKSEPAEDTVAGNPQESRPCDPEQPSPEAKGQEEPVGSGGTPPSPPQGPAGTADQEQVILGLGQELDVDNPLDHSNEPSRQKPEPGERVPDGGEDSPRELRHKEGLLRQLPEHCRDGVEEAVTSPEDLKSHPDKADKDGLEEEDDEDFDDLTQDEEDEEVLSSASEESALSVPELQETMQKLTWLASERRLSQEGDSEEEISQEENSEPEEEEEGEGLDLKEADGVPRAMVDKEGQSAGFPTARREISAGGCLPGEGRKLSEKGKASSRSRAKRGRRRISKDTSKLLLLYDEDILNNDPLREQKDMAFAQAYLSKVREALQDVPGKYEEFLRILYDFETNPDQRTAVDLYGDLCDIIQDWPQLLKDFAAFLLPEQALQCGLFEEQQAFDKSRKFLRQLEICFAENPTHYQKIIKALQSCMVCSAPDVAELKVQVWQLLKGHHHLQDEFSLFFDSLRPPSSRMSDFEEVNWSEDKEYEFDGFEEVVLPDLEDDEEVQKLPPPPRNKKRREGHTHDKSLDSKSSKGKDSVSVPEAWSPQPGNKDPGKAGDMAEDYLEQREDSHTPDLNKTSLALSAPSSGRSQCLPLVACGEGDPWGSLQSPGPDHSLEDGDEMESVASRFRIEAPSSPVGSTDGTWSPVAEGEGNSESQGDRGCSCDSSPPEWRVGGEEEADGAGAMRGTAANGVHGFRESTCGSQGDEQARLGLANTVEPQPAPEMDPHGRVAAAGEQSPQKVGKLGEGASRPTEENGTPRGVSRHPPGHTSVKFASAGAQIRFMSCQKLSDLSPIDLRLTLACRASSDGSFQNSGDHEPAPAHTATRASTRDSPAVSPSLGHGSDSSLPQTESGEPSAGEGDEHYTQAQAAVCAQNTRLSSTGERVVLWTREADRAILTACRESGANEETFRQVAQQLNSKSSQEVSQRFRELMWLFHTSGDASTDEEEDTMSSSNPEQLSDRQVSDEEQD